MTRYVIITPVRDEEKHIDATIESVSRQSIRPVEWVIVDDGSSDRTGEIIDQYAARLPWLHVVHRPNRGFRQSGGGVVDAFYDGYDALRCNNWDFIVKLDGDLSFAPDFFEKCFQHFDVECRLGIGGGEVFHELNGQFRLEKNPRFHVRGANKIYRKACWEEIGGLWRAPGWDTIDEIKANMRGWKTYSFENLRLVHHRFTGAAEGHWRDNKKHGLACYNCGYHPLFVVASCVSRLPRKPYFLGSIAVFYGFLRGYFTDTNRINDKKLISYVRLQQLRRLFGMETIWR